MKFSINIIGLSLVSILLLSGLSCEDPNTSDYTNFRMELKDTITIPAGKPVSTPYYITSKELATNYIYFFEKNYTTPSLIESLALAEFELSILNPSNENLSFVKSIDVDLLSDYKPDKRVAWIDDIFDTTWTSIELKTVYEDIQDYFKVDTLWFNIEFINEEVIPQDIEMELRAHFIIDAIKSY